jgi:hypothetical protein
VTTSFICVEAPGNTGIDPVTPLLDEENVLLGFAKTLKESK